MKVKLSAGLVPPKGSAEVRVLQRKKKQKLAHMLMKADMTHNLAPIGWRPRKPGLQFDWSPKRNKVSV